MKGGAHPSPFAALAFPNSKKVPIFCWVDRVFQSPHGAAEPRCVCGGGGGGGGVITYELQTCSVTSIKLPRYVTIIIRTCR